MDTDTIQERYMKVTKRYLLIVGIWPDQSKVVKYTIRFIVYCIAVPSILAQIARIVCFFNLNILVEQLPIVLATCLLLIKQGTYIVNSEKFKTLLKSMFDDWAMHRSEEELRIMKAYIERGALFGSIYLANAYMCASLFIQIPWWPRILDIVMPLNTSRPLAYVYPSYYFDDDNNYYYLVIAHTSISTMTTTSVFIACDTCYMHVLQHACGLLAVAGYRFRNAVQKDMSTGDTTDLSNETYRRVCLSIQGHQRATVYLKEIEDVHHGYLFICMSFVTIGFSGTLFMVSTMEICIQFYQYFAFLVVQLMHMFFLTLQGQFVINSNEKTYNQIYEGSWYNASPKTQLLYMLALRRSQIAPQMTAGGFITLNLQSFADIIKASVSYFTVLKST